MSVCVCECVCLSARIFQEPHVQAAPDCFCWRVACGRLENRDISVLEERGLT